MKRAGLSLLVLALGLSVHGCGSESRATDACRRIESFRCERAPACPKEYPAFTATHGDIGSCQRFYDVQCGRGIPESAKEPSKTEIDACIAALRGSCDAVAYPDKYCPFLLANDKPAETDTGVAPDTAPAPDAPDGG